MQKFVVLSQPRSGTHMVGGALASRPDVYQRGEIFGYNVPNLPLGVPPSGRAVLEATWALGEQMGMRAAGGLMHPSVLRKPAWGRDAYDALLADPDVRIVRVFRRNLLHMLVSLRQAEKCGHWRVPAGHAAPQPRVRLGPVPRIVAQLDEWQAERQQFHDAFYERFRDVLPMWYEELVAEFDDAMHLVQEFLNLDNVKLTCPYVKQRQLPMSEVVEDWKSVVDGLRGTEYQVYLEA